MLTKKKFFSLAILVLLLFSLVFPSFVFAQNAPTTDNCDPQNPGSSLCNPLQIGGEAVSDLKTLALKVILILAGFTTLMPIIGLTFAGFVMITSQGNPESVKYAKTAFTWTIYGFILAISSYIVIAIMINFLGATALPDPDATPQYVANPLAGLGDDVGVEFLVFLKNLLVGFLQAVGTLALLMIIISGFRYITSAGNEEQATQAKEGLKWALAGVAGILLAYVVVRALATFFQLP